MQALGRTRERVDVRSERLEAARRRFAVQRLVLRGPEDGGKGLDDDAADCELWHKDGQHRKIQITVAQANERRYLMTELNNRGIGRGYLGLTDDQDDHLFESKMSEEPCGCSPSDVEKTLCHALGLCLSNKKHHFGTDTF